MGALLSEIWRVDPRVPSIASRRAWALANGYDPRKVNQWFNRRKAADKKAGRRVSEELYELSVDASTSLPSLAKDKDTALGDEDSVSDGADLTRSSGSRSSSAMPPSDWTVNSFPSPPLRFLSPFPATKVRSSVDLTHNAGTKISTSAFRAEADSVDFADPLSVSGRNLARVYAPEPVSGTTLATAARTLEDLAELPCSPYFSASTPAALDPCTNPDCLLCAPEDLLTPKPPELSATTQAPIPWFRPVVHPGELSRTRSYPNPTTLLPIPIPGTNDFIPPIEDLPLVTSEEEKQDDHHGEDDRDGSCDETGHRAIRYTASDFSAYDYTRWVLAGEAWRTAEEAETKAEGATTNFN